MRRTSEELFDSVEDRLQCVDRLDYITIMEELARLCNDAARAALEDPEEE